MHVWIGEKQVDSDCLFEKRVADGFEAFQVKAVDSIGHSERLEEKLWTRTDNTVFFRVVELKIERPVGIAERGSSIACWYFHLDAGICCKWVGWNLRGFVEKITDVVDDYWKA